MSGTHSMNWLISLAKNKTRLTSHETRQNIIATTHHYHPQCCCHHHHYYYYYYNYSCYVCNYYRVYPW